MKRLLAVLGIVLAATAVAGQSPEEGVQLRVEDLETPYPPGEPQEAFLVVEYDCEKVDPVQGAEATINISKYGEIDVSGPEQVTLEPDAAGCLAAGTRAERRVPYNVTLPWEAPALEDQVATIDVHVRYPHRIGWNETEMAVAPTFVADVDVALERSRVEVPTDETAKVGLSVANQGNARIGIDLSAADSDPRLDLTLPSGGEAVSPYPDYIDYVGIPPPTWQGTIGVDASLPDGRTQATYDATILVDAHYDDDPSAGSVQETVDLTVTVREPTTSTGPSEAAPAVPGLGWAAIVAAMAVAARIQRR